MSPYSNNPEPLLTGARQTMLSWSKVIESYEEIPDVYRASLEPELAASQDFPYMVLTPPLDRFLRRTNQKLVCDSQDAIHILERTGGQVLKKSYPYQAIKMLEVGIILLKSWITICGQNNEDVNDCATIEFNTSSERHYAVFLKKIRPTASENDADRLKAEQGKFDYLSSLNFKFMNYARNSLVAGESVLESVFQPEIRVPAWKLLGWTFHRTHCLTHLSILTEQELIIIRDDERSKKIKGIRYGGVWQYIRRESIGSVSLEEIEGEMLNLVVRLESGQKITKTFTAAQKTEVELLLAKLQGQ